MTDPYADIAAELRRIAANLDTLAGRGLARPYVSLDIQPHGTNDTEVIHAIDTVLIALTGQPGITYPVPSGNHHHGNPGPDDRSGIDVKVYDRVSDPATRERDAELARLRAEVAVFTGTGVVAR